MTNGNANYFPWEETQEDNILPTMVGHFRVKSLEDGASQNTGKRMFRAVFECVAPMEYAGQQHFENYVVGSDEAPTAILPGQFGTRNFKKLCKAAQVPPNNDVAVLLKSAEGSELLLGVVEYEETQEGQYKGSKRNRVSGYYRIGEREIGVAPKQAGPGVGGVRPPVAPVAPPVQSAPPVGGPPAAPQQQYAPPAPPSAPTAPVAPAVPAAPQTPSQGAPPPQPPAAGVGQVIRCGLCNRDVPIDQFGAHVQRHQAEPNWDGVSA